MRNKKDKAPAMAVKLPFEDVDLSGCKTRDDVRDAVVRALDNETVVNNALDARRLFREQGREGRVRSKIAFSRKHELHTVGPLRRAVLVCAVVTQFGVSGDADARAYSVDVLTY